jgi:hypothetical protein
MTIKKETKFFIDDYLGKLTKKKCNYCDSFLYNCKAKPNEYWCSNSDCPKKNKLGLEL